MVRAKLGLSAVLGMLWGVLGASLCHAEEPSPATITVSEVQPIVDFLASDTLQGRDAGTEGGLATAAYLAHELKNLGLQPQKGDDFRQPFGQGFQNVIAVLPGGDPQLTEEWIVLGAHFDHVGFGNRTNSQGPFGQIHNGADDNASGVSCLLEIAEALRLGAPLSRTVVIAFWDAEEKGLLGSEHWLKSQSTLVPIKFYVNFDMVGRLKDDRLTVFGVRTALRLRSQMIHANQSDMHLDFDWSQRDDSDQHSFYQRQIPYLMPFTGLHYDYHRPSDDVEKLNVEGICRVGRVMTRCITELANDQRPGALRFRGESRHEVVAALPQNIPPGRLGISWSPNWRPGLPLIVTLIESDSPAAMAGLQPGDEIVRVNSTAVRDTQDFMTLLRSAPCESTLLVQRAAEGSPAELTIQLRGCPLPDGLSIAVDPPEPETSILTRVLPQSEAAAAGFLPGDHLLGVVEPTPRFRQRRWRVERAGRIRLIPPIPETEVTPTANGSGSPISPESSR